ncbi:MAG: hypothetical protein ANABAC_2133 [Anaerolineae bacterium]|nr:MAG: hypothetical protein ANABAC_2133 [Anaerolineae bacterium]
MADKQEAKDESKTLPIIVPGLCLAPHHGVDAFGTQPEWSS